MNSLLFFDGACGTYYHELYGGDMPCDLANLRAPERVERIHDEYIRAGASAIRTNSFGVNGAAVRDPKLRRQLVESSYTIARRSAEKGGGVTVFADIGAIYAPGRDTAGDYLEIAEIFAQCGATHFVFETLDELDCVLPAVAWILERVANPTVMITFAVSADGYTAKGLYYRALIEGAFAAGAQIAGLNCVCGPSDMLALVKTLPAGGRKLAILPNSNYPAQTGFGLRFSNNAAYFAEKMLEIFSCGVYAVGGCCGTTPAHIRRTVALIQREGVARVISPAPAPESGGAVRVSGLCSLLAQGERICAVELEVPNDTDTDYLMQAAARLKRHGADVVTLADSPLARPRADSFMLAAKVRREVGIETLPHLACRDKNRIAIHGQLLGANIERVQNVLVVTGDSIARAGQEPATMPDKNVFNFHSVSLIAYIQELNKTLFSQTPFCVAAALNVNAPNFEAELRRADRKEAAGAQLFLTQAIFTEESLGNLRLAHKRLKTKILAGILPLAGYRNAVFLNNEVSGMTIPQSLIQDLEGKSPEETKKISLAFSRRIIDAAMPFCDGFYLMTPRRKIDFVCDLVSYIKRQNETDESKGDKA